MKITRQRLKEIIKEELEDISVEDELGVTEPRREGGNPEERLLNKLLIISKVASAPDAVAAAEMLGLGDDEEVVEYLAQMMSNPMYEPTDLGRRLVGYPEEMEEGSQDPDDWRDAQIEDAQQSGASDGSSGREKVGGYGYFQRYYDAAYDKAVEKNEDL